MGSYDAGPIDIHENGRAAGLSTAHFYVIEQKHTSLEADQDAGYRIIILFYNGFDGLACVALQELDETVAELYHHPHLYKRGYLGR
jgi:hypothetical protein